MVTPLNLFSKRDMAWRFAQLNPVGGLVWVATDSESFNSNGSGFSWVNPPTDEAEAVWNVRGRTDLRIPFTGISQEFNAQLGSTVIHWPGIYECRVGCYAYVGSAEPFGKLGLQKWGRFAFVYGTPQGEFIGPIQYLTTVNSFFRVGKRGAIGVWLALEPNIAANIITYRYPPMPVPQFDTNRTGHWQDYGLPADIDKISVT